MTGTRLATIFATPALGLREDGHTDAELLRQFRRHRDEVAFAVLVARHTPAIRAVSRSWLRAASDIDDATQATFLVLVQKLDCIREPAALGAWLYAVADHVARRMRRQSGKMSAIYNDIAATMPVPDERAEMLFEEIARLPEKYRLPIQLCYSTGFCTAAAAARLGCPTRTLVTRLARARDLLQRRLAARGVRRRGHGCRQYVADRNVGTAHAALALSAGLCPLSSGVSQRTLSLARGVVQLMFWNNLKIIAVVALVATGLTGFVVGQWASADSPKGDRLAILNFRALRSGPNSVAKVGLVNDVDHGLGHILLGFHAFGSAMEGTYTMTAKEKDAPKRRPLFRITSELPHK